MPKRVCFFQLEWMQKKEFSEWLAPARGSKDRAHCKLCSKQFDVGNMGISASQSYEKFETQAETETDTRTINTAENTDFRAITASSNSCHS